MLERINRQWRVLATGFSFLVFGLGGLFLGCVVFPLVRLLVPGRPEAPGISRAISARRVSLFYRTDARGRRALVRADRVRPPRAPRGLILANHPSLIDTVFVLAFARGCNCVVNAALSKSVHFTARVAVRAAGYLKSDAGVRCHRRVYCAELERGGNVLHFPRRHARTPLTGDIRLRRGAANTSPFARGLAISRQW